MTLYFIRMPGYGIYQHSDPDFSIRPKYKWYESLTGVCKDLSEGWWCPACFFNNGRYTWLENKGHAYFYCPYHGRRYTDKNHPEVKKVMAIR